MPRQKKADAPPAMNPELWAVDRIKPYPRNARTHPAEQITLLAALFKRHGVDQPIVVDDDGIILKGHGRHLAAIEAGLTHFPVVQRIGMSDAEKRALRIEDNQVGLMSSWDAELIRSEIAILRAEDYPISLLGFGDVELIQFEASPGPNAPERGTVGNLAERFGIAPFTTLNAREGWWQNRKRGWIALGIRSELGRGENLLKFSDTINEPDPKKRAARKAVSKTEAVA